MTGHGNQARAATPVTDSLAQRYRTIRQTSEALCQHLQPEDYVVQSMPDASPAKWHLAHTTWFFERFVLAAHARGYRRFNEQYHYLFNSYYQTAGEMHQRPRRGLLSRPTVKEILAYRAHVDEAVHGLIAASNEDQDWAFVLVLGLNHEQQHQELLLTDIKHAFFQNPLQLAVNASLPAPPASEAGSYSFATGRSGTLAIGAESNINAGDFRFDNETPRHHVLVGEHQIGTRLVTNGEYRQFISEGGYREPSLWLSDGWAIVNERGWNRPLYWHQDLGAAFTLGGAREIEDHAAVCHISYYEADAFARWAGARLPTEAEWELAAEGQAVTGNLLEAGYWHPDAARGLKQYFGDVWEWTASPYSPYPGFKPLDGTLGEYNGKFMCNQMTVRGGSCVTAADHIRATYRSFFYPDARWQFLGLRLAQDL